MADRSDTQWFVQFPDKISGPFSFAQLQKLASQGRLKPDDVISRDQLAWLPAQSLAELSFDVPDTVDSLPPGHLLLRCSCGKEYAVLGSYAGTLRPCPKCGARNRAPLNSAASDDWEPSAPSMSPLFHLWTLVYAVLSAAGTVVAAVYLVMMLVGAPLPGGFTGPDAALALTVLGCQTFFLFELRAARSWAWAGIQILWAVQAFLVFIRPGDFLESTLRAACVLAIYLLPMIHLYRPDTVDWCFMQRAVE